MSTTYQYRVRAYNGSSESDWTNASATTLSATAMAVQSVTIKLTKGWVGYTGSATVKIVNSSAAAVSGASATGNWYKNNVSFRTRTGTTGSAGTVTLSSGTFTAAKGTAVEFCVTAVTKSGYALTTPVPACSNVVTTW